MNKCGQYHETDADNGALFLNGRRGFAVRQFLACFVQYAP